MKISEVQARAWRNKIRRGFNLTNIDQEFNLTYGELTEAYEALHTTGLAYELADVFIYLCGLSQMCDIDLESAVKEKLAIIEARE